MVDLAGTSSSKLDVEVNTLKINVLGRYSHRVTSDLQYWFDYFLTTTELNKHQIPIPAASSTAYKSFFELMFNDSYSDDSYRYLYREVDDKQSWPKSIRDRMLLSPASAKYYIADNDSTSICDINLYGIEADDITMLDRLLTYRLTPGSATLSGITYGNLTTNLSKMIYTYLDLKLDENYSTYDHEMLMSSAADILEACFEVYLIENIYAYVSDQSA